MVCKYLLKFHQHRQFVSRKFYIVFSVEQCKGEQKNKSWNILQNELLVVKIGIDTADNHHSKIFKFGKFWQTFAAKNVFSRGKLHFESRSGKWRWARFSGSERKGSDCIPGGVQAARSFGGMAQAWHPDSQNMKSERLAPAKEPKSRLSYKR